VLAHVSYAGDESLRTLVGEGPIYNEFGESQGHPDTGCGHRRRADVSVDNE
jgi:hypothetical protein